MTNKQIEDYYNRTGLAENCSSLKALLGVCEGTPVWADFAQGINMLVAGTTGGGKTAFVKSMLAALMKQYTPHDFRLIIYDSKAVDYADIARGNNSLLPLISEEQKMLAALKWLDAEAEHRLKIRAEKEQGAVYRSMPHLFLVIDDFAEIRRKEAHLIMQKLLRVGRDSKIHTILVTSTGRVCSGKRIAGESDAQSCFLYADGNAV